MDVVLSQYKNDKVELYIKSAHCMVMVWFNKIFEFIKL